MLLAGVALNYKRLTRGPVVVPSAAPNIARFSADPLSIEVGTQATLSWKVSGATEVTVEPEVGKRPATDQVLVKPESSTYYVLQAANAAGTVFQEVLVEVNTISPLQFYPDGKSKLRSKQFGEGLFLLRQAAELGETRAMLELGELLMEDGEGHTRNEQEALQRFSKAADAAVLKGMLYVGGFLRPGHRRPGKL